MSEKRFSYVLSLTVFTTGACVMVIEIVAMRLFAPYFGNTLYTSSSIIGVILGALSIGYYLGGRISDKKPYSWLFFLLIAVSGIVTLSLHLLHQLILPMFAYKLSVSSGSLMFSLTFFLLPSIILGMLSPFAVKLKSLNHKYTHAGRDSGDIFFVSTLGSIVGSFVTGFYLIPHFGINIIMVAVSFVLLIEGLLGIFFSIKKNRKILSGFIFIALLFSSVYPKGKINNNVLLQIDGEYQQLTVVDGKYEGKDARLLFQDRNPSSGMYLNSNDLLFEYSKYYKQVKILPEINRTLIIGAGAFSIPKDMLSTYKYASIDVVDIEPELLKISQKYFNLPEDSRVRFFIEDGRRYLYSTKNRYELIFADTFGSYYSTPVHLSTVEFYQLARSRLSKDGMLFVNVVGNLKDSSESFLLSEINTFKSVFPNSLFIPVYTATDKNQMQNVILVGQKGEERDISLLSSNIPVINLKDYKLENNAVLTDDYAPVDFLMSSLLK